MKSFTIKTPKGERTIGPEYPAFIIAEMSGNHNQSYEKALKLIDIAVEAGVDAIKLQTYTADTLTINCDKEPFQVKVNDAWAGKTLYDLYKIAYTPWEWQKKLKDYAESKGVLLFSTPFDVTAVDFLEKMDVQLYKVASFETGHIPLLKKIGQTKKPVIMSRGLTSIEELELAIKTLKEAGAPEVAVLHCVSSYPATPDQMNLKTIPDIAHRLNVIAGLSDHSLGIVTPIAAVVLGACVIEKHFTTSRAEGGVDSAFSLEAQELKEMVRTIRETEAALGKPTYKTEAKEAENMIFKQSVFIVEDIKAGEIFTEKNIRIIRPSYGLAPKYFEEILGKTACHNIEKGTPLKWNLIKEKIIDNKITFKPATKNDYNFLFELRNDPFVRANSTHSEEIEFKNHKKWLSKSVAMPERKLLIVMLEEKKIGQVRFDKDRESNSAEISISLIKEYRGQGLGNTIIEKSCQFAFSNFGYRTIQAKIKKDNESSIKSFQKGGFKEEKQDENYLFMELTIKDDS